MSTRSRIIPVALLLLIPVLIFWMWLLSKAIRSSWLCPRECWCDPEEDILDCSHASLKELPQIYHSYIYKLYLDHNNLSTLAKKAFVSKSILQIESLHLDHCEISYIDVDAFNGLILLDFLSLDDNLLTGLKVGTFKNLTHLQSLHLAYNRIENLDAGIFEGLTSLEWLDLAHNLLYSLGSDTFIGLTNLKKLLLWHNRLSTLHPDVFMHLTKLNALHLDENEELQIPSNSSFLNIQTVEELDISDCNISSVMPISFENATNLTKLVLSNNNLKTIDYNIFRVMPKLTHLFLYGNPLECDCELLKVWRWCQEHNIEVVGYTEYFVLCESPEQVSGLWWGVLGKAQCKNGSIMYEEDYNPVVPNYVETEDDYYSRLHDYVTYVEPVIYILLLIFGAIGNVVILVVIICNSEMHTIPNVYIMNLAISDLLLLTVNAIFTYIKKVSDSWQVADILCKMFGFLRHSSIGVSAYLICVMSIQRYQVISSPLHNRRQSMTRIMTIATILGIWTICSLFAIPYTLAIHFGNECHVFFSWKYYQKAVVFELLVFCIFPLGITICMYCLAARHLMRSSNIESGEVHNQGNSRRKTARILLSFTLVFVLSLLPYHLLWTSIVRRESDYPIDMLYLYIISKYLLLFNSCFNPVALCCSSKCYRRYLKHYLLKCCGRKSPTTANIARK
ncbi:uncharacterized protein [Periplaneta americana]|uniref:uncharacterized protein n=1 Tax=Periplaneta americana TaxID=6978 RepID=UPI0037E98BF2